MTPAITLFLSGFVAGFTVTIAALFVAVLWFARPRRSKPDPHQQPYGDIPAMPRDYDAMARYIDARDDPRAIGPDTTITDLSTGE